MATAQVIEQATTDHEALSPPVAIGGPRPVDDLHAAIWAYRIAGDSTGAGELLGIHSDGIRKRLNAAGARPRPRGGSNAQGIESLAANARRAGIDLERAAEAAAAGLYPGAFVEELDCPVVGVRWAVRCPPQRRSEPVVIGAPADGPAVAYSPLRIARRRAGLTIAALASLARLSDRNVRRIETGERGPRRETRQALAAALRMQTFDLWPEETPPMPMTIGGPRPEGDIDAAIWAYRQAGDLTGAGELLGVRYDIVRERLKAAGSTLFS